MVLSVIIVSYNVKYFLEQCLCSVRRAAGNDVEVLVVDNNSTDGTLEYLCNKFPFVQFITNSENIGFAKANNQALGKARGRYVLFLNPDTIIPEDLFTNCIAFMESHAEAGAIGVRMIDGSGKFLKESKRGFPSPWAAFCKMSGLTYLFPRSAVFAKYYMGHLHENKIHEVDALAGACMFARKDVLNRVGGFDEQFFMYAEDIDLSYRVQQVGYKNYYYPGSTIIHFKGESTKRDSRYIKLFYKAMIQFSRKHFKAGIGNFFLELAIRVRSSMASAQMQFAKKKNIGATRGRVLVVGEKEAAEKLVDGLVGYDDIKISGIAAINNELTETSCDEIVFCESTIFSFKKIIELVNLNKTKASLKFSAAGSKSIIGSSSKSEQGDVIHL